MPAIKFEALGVNKDAEWDAGENIKRLKEDQSKSYYQKEFAWEPEDAGENKSDYKFAHHLVSEDGDIGEACLKACAAIIASLNGGRNKPDIPEADFKGVYEHAKKHYEEAGISADDIPELKCDSMEGEGGRGGDNDKDNGVEEFDPDNDDHDEDDPDDDQIGDDPVVGLRSKKDKVEYRAVQVRAAMTGGSEGQAQQRVLEGRPIVFDKPTPLFTDWDGNTWFEQIDKNALEGVDLTNVVLKYNHSMHVPPFASTKAKTLDLTIDSEGMNVVARLANTTQASDIHELVRTGELDKMSFAFVVDVDHWDEKTKMRTIFRFGKIYDVSVVDFPAYEDTSVAARSKLKAEMEFRHNKSMSGSRAKIKTKLDAEKRAAEEAKQREQETRKQAELAELRKKLILKTYL